MLRTFVNGTVLGIAFCSFIVFSSQKRLFWENEKQLKYTILACPCNSKGEKTRKNAAHPLCLCENIPYSQTKPL